MIEAESWLEPFIKDEITPEKAGTSTGVITMVAEERLGCRPHILTLCKFYISQRGKSR
ncbi:hypothetical protein LY56_03211 [Roseinatronobacter thiooxidans]|uniref:Uncharacterized protein n=1 Tax=Roseinatronobacter thiooxidans TaxID=121821 RepID=A0A2W7PLQ1_9RHOB|nr:hypothetical protein LY56_03211 [Roseinatronobacter thiooxidans]